MEKRSFPHLPMYQTHREHLGEEALERFLLGKSSKQEVERIETHLLVCESCIEEAETCELRIGAMRVALSELEAEQTTRGRFAAFKHWMSWLTLPRLSFSAAGLAAAAAAIVLTVPSTVKLTAYRGTGTPFVSEWRPLRLHLDATDLAAGPVQVALVDDRGEFVWKGQSIIQNDALEVKLPRLIKAGPHFVRLYSNSETAEPGELLREFAVVVR